MAKIIKYKGERYKRVDNVIEIGSLPYLARRCSEIEKSLIKASANLDDREVKNVIANINKVCSDFEKKLTTLAVKASVEFDKLKTK